MKKLKKILSLALAAAFIAAAMPLATLPVFAEGSETILGDGSVWLADMGAASTVSAVSPGDYKITASAEADSGYKLVPASGFRALTDSVGLACDYRDGALSFGFRSDYSLDNLRSTENGKGKIEFYMVHSGTTYTVQIFVNGTAVNVASITGVTRATRRDITIVEQDGSYYAAYNGVVINGSGLSDNIKEILKLENHFPAELLGNNGMLYFFATADKISTGNGARIIIRNTVGSYTRNYSQQTVSGDGNDPASWVFSGAAAESSYADGKYTVDLGIGATSAVLGIPVTEVEAGAAQSGIFRVRNKLSATPSANRWQYFDFSNDPAFPSDATESLSIVYVQGAGTTNHVIYNGKTVGTMLNGVHDSTYDWRFTSDGSAITGIDIHSGTFGGTFSGFGKLAVGKPIYMRVRKDYYTDGITLSCTVTPENDRSAEVEALNSEVIAAAENASSDAAKAAADKFYASELRYASSAAAEAAASKILNAYSESLESVAAAISARIAAFDKNSLTWQDKAALTALNNDYNALSDAAKALVTNADVLAELVAYVETLEFNKEYTAPSGEKYYVDLNTDFVTPDSASNGGLTLKLADSQYASSKETGVKAATAVKQPVMLGKWEFSHYFGSTGSSSNFGISVYSGADIFIEGRTYGTARLFRMESGNTTRLYTEINGNAVECARFTATRAHLYTVNIVKQNGSWYFAYDGKVIDGTGYSAEVQNALKLENRFGAEFFENNELVNAFTASASLHNSVYFRSAVTVENGVIADSSVAVSDRNGGTGAVTSYNRVNSTVNEADGKTTYSFNVPNAGNGVILANPINPDGFALNMEMATASGNQWVMAAFSNDPTFTDGSETELAFVQFTNGEMCVFKNGEVSHSSARGSSRTINFFKTGFVWNASIVKGDSAATLKLRGPAEWGDTVTTSAPDLSSLLDKPVYIKITGAAGVTPKVIITTDTAAAPAITAESTEAELSAFYADTNRYVSREAMETAAEVYGGLIAAAEKSVEESEINTTVNSLEAVDWFVDRDTVAAMNAIYATFSEREKLFVTSRLATVNSYLAGLATADADALSGLRKTLLGSENHKVSEYDYRNDGSLDILDLVRLKKDIASKKG